MTNVKDVLHGQRSLLRQDDIAVLIGYKSGSGSSTNVIGLPTGNSHFSSDSSTNEANVAPGNPGNITPEQASAGIGRMYNNGNDVVVNITQASSVWTVNIWDPVAKQQYSAPLGNPSPFQPYEHLYTQIVMGDVNGDGLKDALLFYASNSFGNRFDWGLSVVSAQDPKIVGSIRQGAQLHVSGAPPQPAPITGAFVAGDFDSDGRDEIASLLTDGKTIQFYEVDPTSLNISQSTTLTLPNALSPATLVAGRFRNTLNDELVVVGQISGATQITIYSIQMYNSDGQFSPAVAQTFTAPGGRGTNVSGVLAQAAPILDWYQSNYEQVLIGLQYNAAPTGIIWIAGFDSDFSFKLAMTRDVESERGCLLGMQVGNFDSQTTDSQGNRVHNPNLQLALFELQDSPSACTAVNGQPTVKIVDINVPTGFDPQSPSSWPAPSNWLKDSDVKVPKMPASNNERQFLALATGDLQGRSLTLGAPEKVVIPGQVQPDVVLGMPPMHIDYIKPGAPHTCPNGQTQCVFNVTVKPTFPGYDTEGFSTKFVFSSSSTSSSDRSATTSWSLSVKDTVEAKATFNDGEEGGSVDFKNAMTNAHDGTVAKSYKTYKGISETFTATTGFADYILYTAKDMNVYYYPVLNQTLCPATNPTCPDSQKKPAYAVFSVPDNVSYVHTDGTTQEWYQPVHEPGNIFSYPWTLTQLRAGFSDELTLLTPATPSWYDLGTAEDNLTANWTDSKDQTKSVGSTSTFSDDLSISSTATIGEPDVDGGSLTETIDLSASTSLNTLNVSSTSLSASQGITVNIPQFDNSDCCAYSAAGYIFGQSNTSHQQANGNGSNGNNVDISATGPLYVGFLVDPQNQRGAKPWWRQAYTRPDVALNHPQRWHWDTSGGTSGTPEAYFYTPNRKSVMDSPEFYQMKGFFITLNTSNGSANRGPSLTMAKPGDQLMLTARVYNYSFIDAQSVHVRFYGQYFCASGNSTEASCVDPSSENACLDDGNKRCCPIKSLCRSGFTIGDASTIDTISGFQKSDDSSNWTKVSVPFNTATFDQTKNGNIFMAFWVVVWMQDTSGNMLTEMPGHGLKAAPPSNIQQITDVDFEDYSNNVGVYGLYTPFFICPVNTPCPTPPSNGAADTSKGASHRAGKVSSIRLSGDDWQMVIGKKYKISANFNATEGVTSSLTVAYYDGHPLQGGKLVDVQRIPYIPEGGSYNHRIFFTPDSCGDHTLYAQTFGRGGATTLSEGHTTRVLMDYGVSVQSLMAATNRAKLLEPVREELLRALKVADRSFREQQFRAAQAAMQLYVQTIESDLPGITRAVADPLINHANTIMGCLSSR